jgi:hypothetical protein
MIANCCVKFRKLLACCFLGFNLLPICIQVVDLHLTTWEHFVVYKKFRKLLGLLFFRVPASTHFHLTDWPSIKQLKCILYCKTKFKKLLACCILGFHLVPISIQVGWPPPKMWVHFRVPYFIKKKVFRKLLGSCNLGFHLILISIQVGWPPPKMWVHFRVP